jgi:hypothetical protein
MATLAERLAQQDMLALSDAQAAAALNVEGSGTGSTWQDVPAVAVYRRLMIDAAPGAASVPAWGLLELNSRRVPTTAYASAASTPNAQDQMIAHITTLVRWVQSSIPIEATDAEVRARFSAMFGALVTGGWVSSATRDAIIALAQRPATWAEQNGYPGGVTSRDVGLARGGAA